MIGQVVPVNSEATHGRKAVGDEQAVRTT